MKKNLFYALIAICILLSLCFASCGNKNKTSDTNSDSNISDTSNHQHSFGEWQTSKESSCISTGERYRACACGYNETETLSLVGHTFNGGSCSVCGVARSSDGIEYMLSHDESYYIVHSIGQCTDKDVFIPNQYNGKPIKKIEEMAFSSCRTMESITIAEGVEVIAEYAFGGCSSLKSIKLPNSLKTIDQLAFIACVSLETVEFGNGLETIESSAFRGCIALKSIVLPQTVGTIGIDAFEGCNLLTIFCKHKNEQFWGTNWNGGRDVVWGHQ